MYSDSVAYTVQIPAAQAADYTAECAQADTIVVDESHKARFDEFFDRNNPVAEANQLAMLAVCERDYVSIVQLLGYLLARGVKREDVTKEITVRFDTVPPRWDTDNPLCRLRHLRLAVYRRGFKAYDVSGQLIAFGEPLDQHLQLAPAVV